MDLNTGGTFLWASTSTTTFIASDVLVTLNNIKLELSGKQNRWCNVGCLITTNASTSHFYTLGQGPSYYFYKPLVIWDAGCDDVTISYSAALIYSPIKHFVLTTTSSPLSYDPITSKITCVAEDDAYLG
jgi:hypothetical protein